MNINFYYGISFWAGFHMLLQDSMGLERYVQWVQTHWIELSPVWGLLVMLLAVVFAQSSKETKT